MDRPSWLKSRTLTTAGVKAPIIYTYNFCEFVKQHGRHVVGRRLTYDALWFVQNYVFPQSHADLLSVRGTYDKHTATSEMDASTPRRPQNALLSCSRAESFPT
jgi:hypothetical protein